jgi:ABC-2 type transport system ATP-binding protein
LAEPVIALEKIRKAFTGKVAVDDVELQIPSSQIFGFLGPNGAGKTTTIRMITRILHPDSGIIRFQGQPITDEDQKRIGYMPEERGLYRKMKLREQVVYILQLKGLQRSRSKELADSWLERFELQDWANNAVNDLSKGMQQKVQFICTIAHQPPLLILDEPFSGLDPVNTQVFQDIIFELRDRGTSIIFSTHRMEQVEEICQQIALINHGRIVLEGEVKSLQRQYSKNIYRLECEEPLPEGFPWDSPVDLLETGSYWARIQVQEGSDANQVLSQLIAHDFSIARFEHELPSLRDIFIEQVSDPQPETIRNNP